MTNFTVNFPPEEPKPVKRKNPFIRPMMLWVVFGAIGAITTDFLTHTAWGMFFYVPYVANLILSIIWARKHS